MTRRYVGLSILFTAVILCFQPLQAQQAAHGADTTATPGPMVIKNRNTPTHPEKIIMAWYKQAGLTPSFEKWAALSPFLDEAKDSEIQAIVNRELNRLSKSFTEFDASKPLIVHTRLNLDDYSTIKNELTFSEFSPATFFAYSLYGEHVAIVPRDIKNFTVLPLTKDKMDDLLGKSGGSRITAELLLKPTLADTKEPFPHDKVNYRLMLADIAEINFWTYDERNPQLLWTWRADWYQQKENNELLDLKGERIN